MNENQYEEIYLNEGQELTDLIQEYINDNILKVNNDRWSYVGKRKEILLWMPHITNYHNVTRIQKI